MNDELLASTGARRVGLIQHRGLSVFAFTHNDDLWKIGNVPVYITEYAQAWWIIPAATKYDDTFPDRGPYETAELAYIALRMMM